MPDISGFGSVVQLRASNTFPVGINLTQFADDADPFDLPSVQIADKAKGVNGDLVTWSVANPYILNLAMVPSSEDDKNLQILFDSNSVAKGKSSARDVIDITVIYPDGTTLTLKNGKITDGMPGNSIASAGRLKTKTFAFAFESASTTA